MVALKRVEVCSTLLFNFTEDICDFYITDGRVNYDLDVSERLSNYITGS